jgi:hypothetical protein
MYGSLVLFQLLALEDNLIDCFHHLPMLENVPSYLHMQISHRLRTLSCSSCGHRSPISILKNCWRLICLYGAIKKPKINPGVFINAQTWCKVVLPHAESCGPGLIDRHNVIDILQFKVVEAVVAPCAHCQHYKNFQQGHGTTAPHETDGAMSLSRWVLSVQRHE